MAYNTILYDKRNGVATITLNRPKRLNAMTEEMTQEMASALEDAQAEAGIRALILTGTDPGFCAGADIETLATRRETGPALYRRRAVREGADIITSPLHNTPLPTIAAVNGVAAGAGYAFALACDIRIASEKARFSSIFIRRGICPDFGTTYFLSRLVGTARACELMFTGDVIDARQAEKLGIVNRVVPHEELMPAARELAERIAKGPPIALGLTKRAIHRAPDAPSLESHLVYEGYLNNICFATEDFQEGVRSFIEKREPRFQGR